MSSVSGLLVPNNFNIVGSGSSTTGGFTPANCTILSSLVVQTGKMVSCTLSVQLLSDTPTAPAQLNIGQLTGVNFPPASSIGLCTPLADPFDRGTVTISNAGGVFITGGITAPYLTSAPVICTFSYPVA